MSTTIPNAFVSELPLKSPKISAKRLRDISSKSLADQATTDGDGVIALTRYNNVYAYVVPAEVAEKAFRAQKAAFTLLHDWVAAVPYIEAALAGGAAIKGVLVKVLKDNSDGQVAIDFASLASLLADTPIRFDLNEDETPITRTNFKTFTHTPEDEDEDYSKFNLS